MADQATIDQCMIIDRHRLRRQLGRARSSAERQSLAAKITASATRADARRRALPDIHYPAELPVSARSEEIIQAIRQHRVLIVAGDTGSGKSTQLPKLCLAAGQGIVGQIAHTQPRRIAARAISARLAEELQLERGAGVGYRVRFDEKTSPSDYIRVLTDGMLLAEAQADRYLNQYDTIIIDEAHERSLNIDFLLGMMQGLLKKRPDLKLIITSATIDTEKFSKHFNNAPVVNVSGRSYPVEVRYQPPKENKIRSDRQTSEAILEAIQGLFSTAPGHTLVFLPGEREIRETERYLKGRLKTGIEILPLYARLAGAQQARLFRPSQNTRIILSTNVAETSLTLPGIDYVIDTGLARISRYSPGRRVNTLPIEPISRASADQRKGRCGRTKAGICIRLYDEHDYQAREDYTSPEILRTALTGVVLALESRGLGEPEAFPFIDPPKRKQWNAARQELRILGALDAHNALTPIGRVLAKLAVDPRIGRMLYAAGEAENCLAEMTVLAASLEIPDPRVVPYDALQAARQHHQQQANGKCDFFTLLELYQAYESRRARLGRKQLNAWCQKNFLAPSRMREWRDLVIRLRQDLFSFKYGLNTQAAGIDAVHRALLCGLLDQVAMKTDPSHYAGTYGKQLAIFPGSAMAKASPKWIMAAEMVETSRLFARGVAPIKAGWIEEFAGSQLRYEYSEPHWSARAGQVMAFQRAYFLNLPIFSGRRRPYGDIDPVESRAIFIRDGLVEGGLSQHFDFVDHNLGRIDEVRRLEHKIRRHDVLVSEQSLANYYARHLPEQILSESHLQKWLKTCGESARKKLYMTQADLLKRELKDSEQNLPEQLECGDYRLDLDYLFTPGKPKDGISARVPLPLLNQLSQEDFERLVPGYLGEKIEYLIRTLPKPLRKQLTPVTDSVAWVIAALQNDQRPLLEALAELLSEHSGQAIHARDFSPGNLPDHLSMKLVLVDDENEELGCADSILALQQDYGDKARDSIRQAGLDWQRNGFTSWQFEDLPATVKLRTHGLTTQAYPAIVDMGNAVDLQLFDDPQHALVAHGHGLTRLLQLGSDFGKSLPRRSLPYWQEISLRYTPVGSPHGLRSALLDAIILEHVTGYAQPVRRKVEFERTTENLSRQFARMIEPYCEALQLALNAYGRISSSLDELPLPEHVELDMRTQIEYLIYDGFLYETSLTNLLNYPLYFRALDARLERLNYDPQSDIKKLSLLSPYQERYLQSWEAHPGNPELEAYRWLLEAYRISLFAPRLKPPMPISPKRLEHAWQAFKARH